MGLFVCSDTMADLEILFEQTAILVLSKGYMVAFKVWETLYAEISRRGIEQTYEKVNESSDLDDVGIANSDEINQIDNPFVDHFARIERRVLNDLAKNEVEQITNDFYNPGAWKKFMCNWVPKIPFWTALALGDLGRHGTS